MCRKSAFGHSPRPHCAGHAPKRQLEEMASIGNILIFILAVVHVLPFVCSLHPRYAGPAPKRQREEIAPLHPSATAQTYP
eukprot:220235-Pelagomonas_calceolata.AAC.3